MNYSNKEIEDIINNTFSGLTMFVKDINLDEILENYNIPGIILREKAYVDATAIIGGISTTHRYCILSNHMCDLSQIVPETLQGHCLSKRDGHFKVLKKIKFRDKTLIILLHLPDDETWKLFENSKINLEDEMISKTIEIANKKFNLEPIKEFSTKEWLKRCSLPIGMNKEDIKFKL
ncbi:MAG: hypothetical protein PHG03_02415 [Bacilli bacterium]|nr:hypothetical protein [Bacilli bacterium]